MKLDEDLSAHYLQLDFSENFLSNKNADPCIQLPYPINKPLKFAKIDIIDEYNKEIEVIDKELTTLCKDFSLVKDQILNQDFTNSHATITKGLLNYCNKVKPEVRIPCDYNPYYSGGFLEHFCLNGSDYLVRPDCKNVLRLTHIEQPWKNRKLHVDCDTENSIIELSSYNDNGTVFLLLNYKNQINIVKLNDLDSVAEISWKKNFKKDIFYSKLCKTKVGVISSDLKIQLYDIASKKKINLNAFNRNSVTCFDFIDDCNIAILTQKKFEIFDLRSNDHKEFQPESNSCNYLCSMQFKDNLVYLGTRHHLIRTDLRYFKNVEYCTHLMKYSPCYMDSIEKFVCLSSQKVEDKILFFGDPISSLPLNIPSICDSFSKCRLQKEIPLRGDVEERLEKSVGGIKLMAQNNDIFLYSTNSLGDIFKQKISTNFDADVDPIESLHHWITNLPDVPKPLHLTTMANMSDARFALNKKVKQQNLLKFTKKSRKVNYFLNHFKNRYHRNNLSELAANFATIWDDDEEEPEDVDIAPEVAPLDKVNSWIQSNNYFFD